MRPHIPSSATAVTIAGLLTALLLSGACGGDQRTQPGDASATPAAEAGPPPDAGQSEADHTQPIDSGPLPLATGTVPPGVAGELVFQSDVQGRPKIFQITLPSADVRQLTHGDEVRDETPRWSPDGQRILFASTRAYYGDRPAAGEPVFDLHVMDADGSHIRRLTSGNGNERDGGWFPDGRSVVYWSDGESRGDLYRLWLADGRVERLTRNFVGRAIMPTVSPDGTRVAFASQSLRVGAFWNYQVQVLDLASGTVTPVGTEGGTCWPMWFDDGRTVGFVQLDPEPSRIQRTVPGETAAQTLAHLDGDWLYYPRLSADARWLAVSVSPEHHDGEDWDLAVVPLDGSGTVTRITAGPGNDRLPDWRPTPAQAVASVEPVAPTSSDESAAHPPAARVAGTLAFQSDRDGRDKIYTLEVSTGAVTAVTHGPDHRDEAPAWSPDGTRLAFHTNRFDSTTFDVAVMQADGQQVRRVTSDAAWDQDPVWMPDGRSLVYTSEREGTGAIYRVSLDDGRIERLSITRNRAIMPAVSPDGRMVAYAVATARGFQIFTRDLQTGTEQQVTRVDGGACRPAWSVDGTRLAYVRMQGDEPSWLEELEVAGGQVQRLADARPFWSYYPRYAPGGEAVAFAISPEHHAGEDWDLAVTDPTAPGGFRRLTRGPGNDRLPAWRPR